MKPRAQRTHYMGTSNRDEQAFNLNNNFKTQSVFQRSFNKTKSLSHKTNADRTALAQYQIDGVRTNPFLGSHNQFQTQRFDKMNVKPYKYQKMNIPTGRKTITFAPHLNKQVRDIQDQFNGKKINMHKLKQLKLAFVKNNKDRRNMQDYFNIYSVNGAVDANGIKKIVKEYGFDVNQDQANLIIKLTNKSNKTQNEQNNLNIESFIQLMTRDDVFYRTLKINQKNEAQLTFSNNFSQKVHQILRNKFPNLKQAFKIYRMRNEKVGFKQYQYVMKKLDLTDLVLKKQQRDKIFNDYSDENGQLNVQGLICAIAEQQYKKRGKYVTDFQPDLNTNKEFQFNNSKKNRLFDLKNLPNLQFQNEIKKAKAVIQELKLLRDKKKEKRQDIDIYKNLFSSNYTSRDQIIKNTEKILKKQGINFHKDDYEAFGAYLNYDVNGNISLQKVNHQLFIESEKQARDRMDRRIRNEVPKYPKGQQSQYLDEPTAINTISKIKARRMNPETRQLFKFLDKDKDGYVSKDQFKQKISSLHVVQDWQIQNLADFLKVNQEGSINFRDFSKKINQDLKVLQRQLPLVRSQNSKSCYQWLDTTKTKKGLIKNFNQSTFQRPTKFSAWPSNITNPDLSLIQPPSQAAIYASQTQRFGQRRQDYARKEKMIVMAVAESRRQKIAQWNSILQERAQANRQLQEQRQAAKNYAMRMTKQKYQLNCHQ